MADLSVLIPARNEVFLAKTIENVLVNIRGDTEVIAVCDGSWPEPPINDHRRVVLIHHTKAIGQRAGVNEAARLSRSKYLMKLDAHCAVGEGFDVELMKECERDWTVIPRMYNLHAFDWVCANGHHRYQGPPGVCEECKEPTTQEIIWKPRKSRRTDFARFDKTLHFQYWKEYDARPEAKGDIADLRCSVDASHLFQVRGVEDYQSDHARRMQSSSSRFRAVILVLKEVNIFLAPLTYIQKSY